MRVFFHSLVEVICMLGGKKHILSSEKKSGSGRIDSIFYPILSKSNTIIIHEYKILKQVTNIEHVNKKIQEAFWQVYEKCYLQEAITKFNSFEYSHYHTVDVRAIVILSDENNRNFGMKIDVISHNMTDSIKILNFFKVVSSQQLISFKNTYDIQKILLEITASQNSEEAIVKLNEVTANLNSTNSIPEAIMRELEQSMRNASLTQSLILKHGEKLFDKTQEELLKYKGVGKFIAKCILEIGEKFKKGNILLEI